MATNEASFVASSVNIEVEGDITVPGAPDADDGPSTLDEPVIETLVSFFEQSISCPDEVDFFNIQLYVSETRFEISWAKVLTCSSTEAKQKSAQRL